MIDSQLSTKYKNRETQTFSGRFVIIFMVIQILVEILNSES